MTLDEFLSWSAVLKILVLVVLIAFVYTVVREEGR